MDKIVDNYLNGLKKAYYDQEGQEIWDDFENIKHGISKEDEEQLKLTFPQIPESLIQLLQFVDGTYWRAYQNEKIAFFFLGSDIQEYPYYLLDAKLIIENKNQAREYYAEFIDRKQDWVEVGKKITTDSKTISWLHFSDCMNNGGTSQLYIDFSPSSNGKVGQVIRYLHDPDEFLVIAESFDAYLKMLIDDEFQFIVDYMLE